MDPLILLAAISASIDLTQKLLPMVDQLKASGQITPEQQKAVLDQYASLRARADGQFSGPQWRVSTPTKEKSL